MITENYGQSLVFILKNAIGSDQLSVDIKRLVSYPGYKQFRKPIMQLYLILVVDKNKYSLRTNRFDMCCCLYVVINRIFEY